MKAEWGLGDFTQERRRGFSAKASAGRTQAGERWRKGTTGLRLADVEGRGGRGSGEGSGQKWLSCPARSFGCGAAEAFRADVAGEAELQKGGAGGEPGAGRAAPFGAPRAVERAAHVVLPARL